MSLLLLYLGLKCESPLNKLSQMNLPPLTISLEFELLADPATFVAWQA